LALRQQYTIHGDVLERVEVYKYLGRMMAQDDDDAQANCPQLRKARATWAQVGKVLKGENTPPTVAAKFYLAVVQAVLLYAARHGSSPRRQWRDWKGFTSEPRGEWHGDTNRSGALGRNGFIQSWRMF
jgi:hypothetical protein